MNFKEYYQSFMEAAKQSDELLVEMPQYYPAKDKQPMKYQSDKKFTPVSVNNARSYKILGQDDYFVYVVTPSLNAGFVFQKEDYQIQKGNIIPVMRLALRDTQYKGYKQAYSLRIRESYARQSIASHWYIFFVLTVGGIVSDFEHLEGGKTLWRSLIDHAEERGLQTSLYSSVDNTTIPVNSETPDEQIWSIDATRKTDLIVLEKTP